MRVLGMDTSSDFLLCSLAELTSDDCELISSKDKFARRKANQELVPAIRDVFIETGYNFDSLDAIVCGRGPGSFTGVRIAVATAKGLALGHNLPLYGVSTLDALAYTLQSQGVFGEVLILGDAMRKEVYPARYTIDKHKVERHFEAHSVIKFTELLDYLSTQDLSTILFAGDALFKFKDELAKLKVNFVDEHLWYPSSKGLMLALKDMLDEHAGVLEGDPGLLLPIYTRLSDAEENERIKLGLTADIQAKTSGVADNLAGVHLQLRPMSINDIEQVAKLECSNFQDQREVWSEAMFAEEFKHKDRIWWVAHDQGRIIAFAGGQYLDGEVQILDIAVDKAYQKQGIGSKLLSRVSYDGQQLGAHSASLEVKSSNEAAIALYKKRGFRVVGERKNYYGQGSSALLMSASLPLAAVAGEDDHALPIIERSYPQLFSKRTKDELETIEAHRPLILSIETSCDETAMSVIDGSGAILANVVATQIDFHSRFGGVVPEIASRKHTEALVGVYEECMAQLAQKLKVEPIKASELDGISVTQGPGLVGALVVGIAFAKGLALGNRAALIGVNHLEGHLYANLFETPDLKPPFIASLLSGGHTMLVYVKDWGSYKVLGETLDDAVGEAFDKVAKALGLGYPGGPIISKLSEHGDPHAIDFPRAMLHSHDYQFSLSGLKTAVLNYIHNENAAGRPIHLENLAASFEQAVIDVQVAKAKTAVLEYGVHDFCLGGGVAANKALRQALVQTFKQMDVRVTFPPLLACTDNAAMIALVAKDKFERREFLDYDADAKPNLSLLELGEEN
ncbi:MAG: tRNA (adenosine(37)-N6)-threonylcarbamoyltransferase complex transferase subunit TsaD [Coriobacteriia bacterium]|nr:tRNA (adenosine(37)-N6)-threonylcarbamoyltransferase complex transferase subunit TsaD [Coriobacteriia bacterium]